MLGPLGTHGTGIRPDAPSRLSGVAEVESTQPQAGPREDPPSISCMDVGEAEAEGVTDSVPGDPARQLVGDTPMRPQGHGAEVTKLREVVCDLVGTSPTPFMSVGEAFKKKYGYRVPIKELGYKKLLAMVRETCGDLCIVTKLLSHSTAKPPEMVLLPLGAATVRDGPSHAPSAAEEEDAEKRAQPGADVQSSGCMGVGGMHPQHHDVVVMQLREVVRRLVGVSPASFEDVGAAFRKTYGQAVPFDLLGYSKLLDMVRETCSKVCSLIQHPADDKDWLLLSRKQYRDTVVEKLRAVVKELVGTSPIPFTKVREVFRKKHGNQLCVQPRCYRKLFAMVKKKCADLCSIRQEKGLMLFPPQAGDASHASAVAGVSTGHQAGQGATQPGRAGVVQAAKPGQGGGRDTQTQQQRQQQLEAVLRHLRPMVKALTESASDGSPRLFGPLHDEYIAKTSSHIACKDFGYRTLSDMVMDTCGDLCTLGRRPEKYGELYFLPPGVPVRQLQEGACDPGRSPAEQRADGAMDREEDGVVGSPSRAALRAHPEGTAKRPRPSMGPTAEAEQPPGVRRRRSSDHSGSPAIATFAPPSEEGGGSPPEGGAEGASSQGTASFRPDEPISTAGAHGEALEESNDGDLSILSSADHVSGSLVTAPLPDSVGHLRSSDIEPGLQFGAMLPPETQLGQWVRQALATTPLLPSGPPLPCLPQMPPPPPLPSCPHSYLP